MAVAANLWGLAEATVFFVVPDVLLTTVAVTMGRRAAVVAVAFALLGALVGGTIMHRLGANTPAAAQRTLDAVPGISPRLINDTTDHFRRGGLTALVSGSVTGRPYKIYAVAAGSTVPLATFLAASIPARLLRFAATTGLTLWLVAGPLRRWPRRRQLALLAAVWAVNYAAYYLLILP